MKLGKNILQNYNCKTCRVASLLQCTDELTGVIYIGDKHKIRQTQILIQKLCYQKKILA